MNHLSECLAFIIDNIKHYLDIQLSFFAISKQHYLDIMKDTNNRVILSFESQLT